MESALPKFMITSMQLNGHCSLPVSRKFYYIPMQAPPQHHLRNSNLTLTI